MEVFIGKSPNEMLHFPAPVQCFMTAPGTRKKPEAQHPDLFISTSSCWASSSIFTMTWFSFVATTL